MSDQAKQVIVQVIGWRRLKAIVGLALVALTGCFGAEAMHYDIQEYNKQVVSSEKEMLLYNIAALHDKQPPHFMMLATVSQSRTFTGTAGFTWANPATWSVPFTATNTESPTIQFVPVQGQDFAQRFESSLTDKFTLFLEDQRRSGTYEERAWLVSLFAQSLVLNHGDGSECRSGLYFNRWQEVDEASQQKHYYADEFAKCLDSITYRRDLKFARIDAHHPVPTNTGAAPSADNVVTALSAGYEWYSPSGANATRQTSLTHETNEQTSATRGKTTVSDKKTSVDGTTASSGDFILTTPVRIPAWLDFSSPALSGPYVDEIADDVWPIPYDYFYMELRNGTREDAERECHSNPPSDSPGGVVCGYFKIGNLLQIMDRLADTACVYQDRRSITRYCSQSIFGIAGNLASIPSWAENFAPYQSLTGRLTGPYAYVPAHSPDWDSPRAKRDQAAFFNLYKLYQMSLVDTSKLVTGAPSITIPK